jgi:hypothetical protein
MAKAASARLMRSSSWSVVSNGRRVGSASATRDISTLRKI